MDKKTQENAYNIDPLELISMHLENITKQLNRIADRLDDNSRNSCFVTRECK